MADRPLAFDSNVLSYFLDGNNGNYSKPTDALADERIAAVRLFLHCSPFIAPIVRSEALDVPDPVKKAEHVRFIDWTFAEIVPDDRQLVSIEQRTKKLTKFHPKGAKDCRLLAEVEEAGWIPVIITCDKKFTKYLSPHTTTLLTTPSRYWDQLSIPRGTPPVTTPAAGHPIANQTWWAW